MNHSRNTEVMNASGVRFLSPRQLAIRWDCSRTTAQRIADRAGISKYFLGKEKWHGAVSLKRKSKPMKHSDVYL